MYKIDGFDDCILGISAEKGEELRLVYSIDKFVRKIQQYESLTYESAYKLFRCMLENDEDFELPVFVETANVLDISSCETRLQLEAERILAGERH